MESEHYGSGWNWVGSIWREGFKEKVSFEFRVEKSVEVMDNDSGDDAADELRQFGSEE